MLAPFYERVWAIVVAPLLLHSTQKFFNEWHPGFNGGRRARENKDRWEGGVVLSLTSAIQRPESTEQDESKLQKPSFEKHIFLDKQNFFKSRKVLANCNHIKKSPS